MLERAIPRGGLPRRRDDGAARRHGHQRHASPTLGIGIGLGYVAAAHAAPGTHVAVDVRGRDARARWSPKPLYTKEQ